MANGTSHEQPSINRNAAEAGIDPDQLTAQGTPGTDYDEIVDTAAAQTDGTRNPRVINQSTDKRAVQPVAEDASTAYDTGNNGQASGITNQPLAAEKDSQHKVGAHTPASASDPSTDTYSDAAPDTGTLHDLHEVTDTVEISTEKPRR